jgi:hypothetical protein
MRDEEPHQPRSAASKEKKAPSYREMAGNIFREGPRDRPAKLLLSAVSGQAVRSNVGERRPPGELSLNSVSPAAHCRFTTNSFVASCSSSLGNLCESSYYVHSDPSTVRGMSKLGTFEPTVAASLRLSLGFSLCNQPKRSRAKSGCATKPNTIMFKLTDVTQRGSEPPFGVPRASDAPDRCQIWPWLTDQGARHPAQSACSNSRYGWAP